MTWTNCKAALLLILALGGLAGCAGFAPGAAGPSHVHPPFHYESLGVHNSCLVESVHFYDLYRRKMGAGSWVRVLEWGNRNDDYRIFSGHAVAVYVVDGKLFGYDVNFGFFDTGVPAERRNDLTEVAPAIEKFYAKEKSTPVLERYCEDWVVHEPAKAPAFLFYHPSRDVREATRVASELGRFRDVKVVEFDFMTRNLKQTSAAVAFVFNARLCVYFPRGGTHVSNFLIRDVRDAYMLPDLIKRIYPTTTEIRGEPRGYYLVPSKS